MNRTHPIKVGIVSKLEVAVSEARIAAAAMGMDADDIEDDPLDRRARPHAGVQRAKRAKQIAAAKKGKPWKEWW